MTRYKIIKTVSLSLIIASVLVVLASSASAGTTISIDSTTVDVDQTIELPIEINDITDPDGVGTADIKLFFDSDVVHVVAFSNGDFSGLTSNFVHNESGSNSYVRFIAIHTDTSSRLTGNVVIANVMLKAVGSAGEDSPLDIEIITLTDLTAGQEGIPATPDNGIFIIQGNTPPVIVSAAFDNPTPDTGDSITLMVEANDDVGVTSVTANGALMTNTGGDNWELAVTAVEGMHPYDVIAYDVEDLTDTASASYTATTPGTPNEAPVIVSAAFDDPTPDTGDSITLMVEANDDVGVTSVTANGALMTNTGGDNWELAVTAVEGTHNFDVIAYDVEDLTDTASASYTATTPGTPNEAPVIVSAAFDDPTPDTGDSITLMVEANDDVGVTSVTANGALMTNTGGDNWELAVTAVEGTHNFDVIAYDVEDLTDTASASYTATDGEIPIPEFPTIVIPVMAILGLMFLITRRKN